MTASSQGTATILFTDLAGSTAQRSVLGEERADALRITHDALLGSCVERHGGRVVKSMGDGVLAAFGAASEALSAAVAIQQAVAAHNRQADPRARLAVRIGLSVGDVAWYDGDCSGTPVVEAARLEAAAQPGQILCSELVQLMARGRGDHRFEPAGFLELKGLPQPVPACVVLWDEPTTSTSEPVPLAPELRTARQPLLGRQKAMADAVAHLSTAEQPAVLWIVGEPGIGKTRLASELAHRAGDGAIVLFGRSGEDLAVPYQPFVEALQWLVMHTEDGMLGGRLGASAAELTRLVPDIGARLGDLQAPTDHGTEADRFRLFEAVRSWLGHLATDEPVVVVLDDLHWATAETVALLAHVLRRPLADEARISVIVTARDTAPDVNAAIARLADDLTASRRSKVLRLEGLSIDDLLPATNDRHAAEQVHDRTAGNPLFVEVLLRQAALEGGLGRDADIRGVVHRRLAALADPVGALLTVGAVAGLDFDVRVLADVLDTSELDIIDRAEHAAAAGLLEPVNANTYRWVHALVREALLADATPARRARLHAALAAAFQRQGAPAAVLAHHSWEAREVAGIEPAHRWSIAAGEAAERMLSYAEAARHFGRALELLDAADDPPAWCRLAFAYGRNLSTAGDYTGAAAVLAPAGDTACAHHLGTLALEIAIQLELTTWFPGIPGDLTAAHIERALRATPDADPPLTARGLAALARALVHSGQLERGELVGREAIARARAGGDRLALVRALVTSSNVYFYGPDWPPIIAAATEAVDLLDLDHDDPILVAEAANYAAIAAAGAGNVELFRRARPLIEGFSEQAALPFFRAIACLDRGSFAMAEGALDAAEAWIELGAGLMVDLFADDSANTPLHYMLRREQGRLPELLPALRVLVRLQPHAARWRPGLAALYGELGLKAEATVEIDAMAADRFERLPRDGTRMMNATLLTDAVLATGHAPPAAWLYDFYRPLAGTAVIWPGTGGFVAGATDTYLAGLASLLGRHDAAIVHARSALALTERMGWPLWQAHAEAALGAALSAAGDGDGAASAFGRALDACGRHGLAGLRAKVERLRAG